MIHFSSPFIVLALETEAKIEVIEHTDNVCRILYKDHVYSSFAKEIKSKLPIKPLLYHRTIRKIGRDHLETCLNNLKNMELLDRLKVFKERNPDFKDAVEAFFPETIDDKPYIKVNDLFIKKNQTGKAYIYQLVNRKRKLVIRNISLDIYWKGDIEPTNDETCRSKYDLYLTEHDFKRLLKDGGTKIDSIRLVPIQSIEQIYKDLF